jgi:uncharacterized protein (TIGR02246 family)
VNECGVETLYRNLLDRWNDSDAHGFGALFREDGSIIGFDGTSVETAKQIEGHLASIFADHETPTYVSKVREIRPLGPDAALLRAVAGLVPRGATDLEPELTAAQTMVAVRRNGNWRIAHFQNTPADFETSPRIRTH